jgi:hypothetical protein
VLTLNQSHYRRLNKLNKNTKTKTSRTERGAEMMKKVIFLLLFGATIFVSCKKSDLPAPTPTPTDKTDKTAPSVPTNLTQGTVTASSVTFSFTGSTDQGF